MADEDDLNKALLEGTMWIGQHGVASNLGKPEDQVVRGEDGWWTREGDSMEAAVEVIAAAMRTRSRATMDRLRVQLRRRRERATMPYEVALEDIVEAVRYGMPHVLLRLGFVLKGEQGWHLGYLNRRKAGGDITIKVRLTKAGETMEEGFRIGGQELAEVERAGGAEGIAELLARRMVEAGLCLKDRVDGRD